MPALKGTKTEANLKEAFAGESQANRRYLYFAQKADVEGYPDVAALFRSVAEGETGHAFGHFDFLKEVGDPVTGVPVGATEDNLKSAIEGETYEYTEMYPGFAKTARDEGFEEIAEWLETWPRPRSRHAGRFTQGLESVYVGRGGRPQADRHLRPHGSQVLRHAHALPRRGGSPGGPTVFDLCHGCRLCFNLCPSFPTMFTFIDANDGEVSALTDAEQRPGRRRVLPVQALLREVPLRATSRMGAGFPAPHEPCPRGAPEAGGRSEGTARRRVPGAHRCPGARVGRGGAGGQLGHRHARLVAATGHGEDRGTRIGAPPPAIRQATLHHVVQQSQAPGRCGEGGRRRLGLPDVLRGIHGARGGALHRGGLRAQRRRMQPACRHQVLWRTVAALWARGRSS